MWRAIFFSCFKAQSSFLEEAKEANQVPLYEVNCQLVMGMVCFPNVGYLENTYSNASAELAA